MRLIDADALKSNILKRLGIKAECYLLYQERLVWNVIEAQPTADVVERKKGRWLNKGRKICCSECGRINFCKPNFCDECGADMREEEKTDAE